jgi:drug/metabolite transporter (DMT)-like permease
MSTRRFYFLGFGALMLFDTWTQVSFKLASGQVGEFTMTLIWLRAAVLSPWIYGAVAGYLGAFVTWMTLLRHAPVGPAFAASHLEVVAVLIVSVLFFGEHLAVMQIVGGVCVVVGIVFLSRSESKHTHD